MIKDYDLIEASFYQQYGIRLRTDLKKMAWDEFCNLLSGLNEDTPLVRMAQIRKETDTKVMEHWSDEQKRINREWQRELAMNMTEEEMMERLAPFSALLDNLANIQRK